MRNRSNYAKSWTASRYGEFHFVWRQITGPKFSVRGCMFIVLILLFIYQVISDFIFRLHLLLPTIYRHICICHLGIPMNQTLVVSRNFQPSSSFHILFLTYFWVDLLPWKFQSIKPMSHGISKPRAHFISYLRNCIFCMFVVFCAFCLHEIWIIAHYCSHVYDLHM